MAAPMVNYGQKILWMLEAIAFDCAAALARLFPIDRVSDFGGWLIKKLGPLTAVRRIAETNLRIVFPDASDAEIARLMTAQWEELGRWVAEFPIVDRIVAAGGRIDVTQATRLYDIANSGRPVVFISGHFSNFEIMAAAIMQAGVPCQVTYRAANNPLIDERIVESRRRYGIRLFAPKGVQGARELMRAVARDESVALMNDQKFNGGVEGPLFGVTAHTAPGPATYALRFGIPIQPLSVQRVDKARFRVIAHEPILLEDTGDREADVAAGVARINRFIEDRIRERPAEWFWVHKRWPNAVYRKEEPLSGSPATA
jgi:KDO2-lipid IV(A) lauroyltransferase